MMDMPAKTREITDSSDSVQQEVKEGNFDFSECQQIVVQKSLKHLSCKSQTRDCASYDWYVTLEAESTQFQVLP